MEIVPEGLYEQTLPARMENGARACIIKVARVSILTSNIESASNPALSFAP
jgi:hypothetical protein